MFNIFLSTYLTASLLMPQYYVSANTSTESIIASGECKGLTYQSCAALLKAKAEQSLIEATQNPTVCLASGNNWTRKLYPGQPFKSGKYHCELYYIPECSIDYAGKTPQVSECIWKLSYPGSSINKAL